MHSRTHRERRNADLALLGMTAAWGTTFVIIEEVLALVPPQTFLALRFLVGAGAVAAVGLLRRTLGDRAAWRKGTLLGLALYAGFALQTEGLVFTTASRSAFLTGMAVLFVPLLSFAINRRRPRFTSWIGVGLAAIGLLLMTEPWHEAAQALLLGDLLTVGCALAFALHIVGTERWAPGSALEPLVLSQLVVTAACASLGTLTEETPAQLTGLAVAAIVGTGLVATAFAFFLQTWAQQRTTATRAALIFSLEPVFAAIFAALLVGARMTGPEIAGAALILGGVLVAELGPVVLDRRRS